MDRTLRKCVPCEGGVPRVEGVELDGLLASVPGWQLAGDRIRKHFRFADFRAAMAFVNATAWISHREDHHPDLSVHYNRCVVRYSTHDVGGLSNNDFVCAAKAELLAGRDAVVEGRDATTVICPDAPLKLYLDASPEERAKAQALRVLLRSARGRKCHRLWP